MEVCSKCGKSEEEVRLFNAIDETEVVLVCDSCAKIENLPIIKKPTTFQLKEAEKPYSVYQRLSRMAGIKSEEEQDEKPDVSGKSIKNIAFSRGVTIDSLKKKKEEQKTGNFQNNYPKVDLIDNFNWSVMMARRKKGLQRWQLAEAIGESVAVIDMVERGNLPEDDFRIINKLESYLGIRIKKSNQIVSEKFPARVLNFDKNRMNNITISDLQTMKHHQEIIDSAKKSVENVRDELEEEEFNKFQKELTEIQSDEEDL